MRSSLIVNPHRRRLYPLLGGEHVDRPAGVNDLRPRHLQFFKFSVGTSRERRAVMIDQWTLTVSSSLSSRRQLYYPRQKRTSGAGERLHSGQCGQRRRNIGAASWQSLRLVLTTPDSNHRCSQFAQQLSPHVWLACTSCKLLMLCRLHTMHCSWSRVPLRWRETDAPATCTWTRHLLENAGRPSRWAWNLKMQVT